MNRVPTPQSSSTRSIGYDPVTGVMHVEFNNGAIYEYSGIDSSTFQGLMHGPSIGAFLDQRIKSRPDLFPYTKVKTPGDSSL